METQQAVRYVHPDPETHTANKTYTTRSLTPVRPSNTDDKLKMTVDVNGITHITDGETSQYTMEALLGKGGFAKVYRLTNGVNGRTKTVAGKIISKKRITKPHNKDKIAREVDIHKKMKHKNVVQFIKFFEDTEHVFIILEYCGSKTLSGILKTRKHLLEPEVRYYLKQIISGCEHIHSQRVVHRDLKLSNLFINDSMQLKIGDFGLSAYIDKADDKKESICGTPNYISPEVILKAGHSYPVDVWAMGCIIYALLAGRPPFETQCLKDTYKLIAKGKYTEPTCASTPARCLISKCLRIDPQSRPTLQALTKDSFLTHGFIPPTLPLTAMSSPPDFTEYREYREKALREKNGENNNIESPTKSPPLVDTMQYLIETIDSQEICAEGGKEVVENRGSTAECCSLLEAIRQSYDQIKDNVVKTNPTPVSGDDCLWITKWVDYSHKYGFGFQLSNHISGASFKDGLSIAVNGDNSQVGLQDPTGSTVECVSTELPSDYAKKYQVMLYFVKYMNETLIRGGDLEHLTDLPSLSDVYMLRWLRTKHSIVMGLSTGTVQVNFFSDHTKLVVSKLAEGGYQLMYINSQRQASVYNLADIAKYGCTNEVKMRIHYTMLQLQTMLKPWTNGSSTELELN